MTDQRWQEIKALIEEKFEVLKSETLPLEESPGTIEIIEFLGPKGSTRLERTNQPLVIDKKVLSSKRIGSKPVVEYVYSPTERAHKFKVFMWSEEKNDWMELEMEKNSFFF